MFTNSLERPARATYFRLAAPLDEFGRSLTGIERDGSASPIWGSVAQQMPRFTVSKSPNRETFNLPRVPGMPNTNSPKRDGEDTTTEALRLMQDMLASLEDIAASLHLPRLKKLLSEAKQEAADSAGL